MTEPVEEVVIEFPQVYENDDGKELVAINDVQAAAFEKAGFKAAGKYADAGEDQTSELDALKIQADELGIEYSANIGAKTLKERIETALAGQ